MLWRGSDIVQLLYKLENIVSAVYHPHYWRDKNKIMTISPSVSYTFKPHFNMLAFSDIGIYF